MSWINLTSFQFRFAKINSIPTIGHNLFFVLLLRLHLLFQHRNSFLLANVIELKWRESWDVPDIGFQSNTHQSVCYVCVGTLATISIGCQLMRVCVCVLADVRDNFIETCRSLDTGDFRLMPQKQQQLYLIALLLSSSLTLRSLHVSYALINSSSLFFFSFSRDGVEVNEYI